MLPLDASTAFSASSNTPTLAPRERLPDASQKVKHLVRHRDEPRDLAPLVHESEQVQELTTHGNVRLERLARANDKTRQGRFLSCAEKLDAVARRRRKRTDRDLGIEGAHVVPTGT